LLESQSVRRGLNNGLFKKLAKAKKADGDPNWNIKTPIKSIIEPVFPTLASTTGSVAAMGVPFSTTTVQPPFSRILAIDWAIVRLSESVSNPSPTLVRHP